MIQKKICMLGSLSVGKTSLVRRFVSGIFSEAYLTTLGVKIDRREVTVDGHEVRLVLWDLAGEDPFSSLNTSYLRGSAGYVLVADGTRPKTLDIALDIRERVSQQLGDVPFVLALNKVDLQDQWRVDAERIDGLPDTWDVERTSAKSGEGVAAFFDRLAGRMVARNGSAS